MGKGWKQAGATAATMAGAAVFVGVVLVAGFSPLSRALARWFSGPDWAGMDGAARATAMGQFRLAVVQIAAALGAGVALVYTARNYRLTRRGQVTDRFTKALERLGSEEMYVRIGGILALEQIVRDAPDQADDAAQILAAFIRRRTPQALAADDPEQAALPDRPEEDVQAALTALFRPTSRRHTTPGQLIDLEGLHLKGVLLTGANLTEAQLGEANLTKAWLYEANLTEARLRRANLTGARLDKADLTEVHLGGANLTGARLYEANLTEADLTEARLDWADLTRARLNDADLTEAWLVEARLTGARLDWANLTWAGLIKADLTETELTKADLTGVHGLTAGQVVLANITESTRLSPEIATDPAVQARIAHCRAQHVGSPGSAG